VGTAVGLGAVDAEASADAGALGLAGGVARVGSALVDALVAGLVAGLDVTPVTIALAWSREAANVCS